MKPGGLPGGGQNEDDIAGHIAGMVISRLGNGGDDEMGGQLGKGGDKETWM
jgi:hypothetical protein